MIPWPPVALAISSIGKNDENKSVEMTKNGRKLTFTPDMEDPLAYCRATTTIKSFSPSSKMKIGYYLVYYYLGNENFVGIIIIQKSNFKKNQKVIDGTIKITSPLVMQAGRDV